MKRILVAAAAAAAVALSLTACSPGGSSTAVKSDQTSTVQPTNCTNKLMVKNVPTVTVWAWYPNMKIVADNYNSEHKNNQVCWVTEAGGTTAYNKYQTAISAGKGLPDIIMVEADHLPTFEIQGAIIDISKYGANSVKSNFSAGAWKDVSQGAGVYGIPVDGGPMGLIYRQDIFQKAGISTPPTTWDEYAADAQKIKATTGAYIAAENGFRLDVLDALKELKVPNVRWPGGCFVSAYHWVNGIGPDPHLRPRLAGHRPEHLRNGRVPPTRPPRATCRRRSRRRSDRPPPP